MAHRAGCGDAREGEVGQSRHEAAAEDDAVEVEEQHQVGDAERHVPAPAVEEFGRLSVTLAEGDTIGVRGPRGEATVTVVSDPRVGKGTAHVAFNQDGVSAGALIDAAAPVVDLTVVPV